MPTASSSAKRLSAEASEVGKSTFTTFGKLTLQAGFFRAEAGIRRSTSIPFSVDASEATRFQRFKGSQLQARSKVNGVH